MELFRRKIVATVLRGKLKGSVIKIHQFCNNWIMSEQSKIFSPTSLEFSDEEIEQLKSGKSGVLFDLFELVNNRFKRRK